MNPDINIEKAKKHKKPRSWMRYQKKKLYNMRKFKESQDVDIVWQWHSHPSHKKKLHAMDKRILKYMRNGVMIIVVPPNPDNHQNAHLVGWYYKKRRRKKPLIDKMIFEIISK